jgi:transcriptional regulator GlxA family with amidase domain
MSDIRVVKRLIEEHCAEIRSIKDLARFTNYSAETIRKDFVRSENTTLAAFIRTTRVAKARELLTRTDLSCQMICRMVGFSREEVGERAIKRLTGMTMGEQRRLSRIKPAKDSAKLKAPVGIRKSMPAGPANKRNRRCIPELSTRIVSRKDQ